LRAAVAFTGLAEADVFFFVVTFRGAAMSAAGDFAVDARFFTAALALFFVAIG